MRVSALSPKRVNIVPKHVVPVLVRFIESNPAELSNALCALARIDAATAEQMWPKLLANKDPKSRKATAGCISMFSSDAERQIRVYLQGLKCSDPEVRISTLTMSWSIDLQNASRASRIRLLERALEIMNDPNLSQRRGALWLAARFVHRYPLNTPFPDESFGANVPVRPTLETPAELKELETIRAAARKWIEENKR